MSWIQGGSCITQESLAPRSPYPPARAGDRRRLKEAQRQGLAVSGSERGGDLPVLGSLGPALRGFLGPFLHRFPSGSFMWSGTVVSGWGSLDQIEIPPLISLVVF